MRGISIIAAAVLVFNIQVSVSIPLASSPPDIGQPCGQSLGDCAGTLTCIPVSTNCTQWVNSWSEGCPGTCRDIDISQVQIYTIFGGWGFMDDCDERREYCTADPRHVDNCGPSCDGFGICWPFAEVCGGETGMACPEGKACFGGDHRDAQGGMCLPLRFGSDYYEKSGLEEVFRTDQDGFDYGERSGHH
ncbi:hypothetical protein C8A00DRAFT_18516 [Chaetomidium leptoderma]|uniref:Uncharacterized protein n=1 Tax=Chaetomidium leptoderma TaxID=669021 RepID=A0AAN6VEG3_9PEZI|nr:hypothetical protein C8A00DRAFT_18516 [Chaetomidium leptoderma]